MGNYVVVAFTGKMLDGVDTFCRSLTQAMAGRHNVTLLTVGDAVSYGNASVVALPNVGSGDELQQVHDSLLSAMESGELRRRLPEHVDGLISNVRVVTDAAVEIRDRMYPRAPVATLLHISPEAVRQAIGMSRDDALGEGREQAQALMRSDLVLTPGSLVARDGRRLVASPGGLPQRSTHEMIPGIAPESPIADAGGGPPFEFLMSGHMERMNKGAVDVAKAVRDLVQAGRSDIRLTLLGVTRAARQGMQREMDTIVGRTGIVDVREFTDDRSAVERALASSHAFVSASESDAFPQAVVEAVNRGIPPLIAPGNGNGLVETLSDRERFPRGFGMFVIPDAGTSAWRGNVMGAAPASGRQRYSPIAEKMADLMDRYGEYRAAAAELRAGLAGYTWSDAADGVVAALQSCRPPADPDAATRHTRQGPGGSLVAISDEQLAVETAKGRDQYESTMGKFAGRAAKPVAGGPPVGGFLSRLKPGERPLGRLRGPSSPARSNPPDLFGSKSPTK